MGTPGGTPILRSALALMLGAADPLVGRRPGVTAASVAASPHARRAGTHVAPGLKGWRPGGGRGEGDVGERGGEGRGGLKGTEP